ncbi:hypothetical protein CHU32_00710 [Superficieibacter electus]|uniref:Oligosaccharide repeat unit polymerase n=1 Tax=Superficieibacter electus TaxID=2022662 RepID=A0A2P5GVX7_9ENTR|nr:O-antigen polymerase [Superficieibacter electus]POP47699.1 hypothetical protein CHU33_00710 [Superficieibacter electus]POP50710.1 hypothetical protein CHU32_00710 [Superficieibacter electus]
MIYLAIAFLIALAIGEKLISNGKGSPTFVTLILWATVLFLASFYETYFYTISNLTLLWICSGCFSFFVGGLFSKIFVDFKVPSTQVRPVRQLFVIPIYIITAFLAINMIKEGLAVNSNFYIGLRIIINYGDPDAFFIAFGYMYYLIYPVFFISAAAYYNDSLNKEAKRRFIFNFLFSIAYAIMATAKVKLLIIFITWICIRAYYKKNSTRLIIFSCLGFMAVFFLSLLALNKLSEGNGIIEVILSNIGNYTIANLYALDSLNFTTISSSYCINEGLDCIIMPFYDIGYFHTNVYTIIYDFFDVGYIAYILTMFVIGFLHNGLHKIAKRRKNSLIIIFSSILYFPLVYQIINNQYTSSKYLVYLFGITYLFHFFRKRKVETLK